MRDLLGDVSVSLELLEKLPKDVVKEIVEIQCTHEHYITEYTDDDNIERVVCEDCHTPFIQRSPTYRPPCNHLWRHKNYYDIGGHRMIRVAECVHCNFRRKLSSW